MKSSNYKLQDWIKNRYDLLWKKFGNSKFTFEEALEVIQKKEIIKDDDLSTIINELKNKNWLIVSLSKVDSRKRIYQLKSEEIRMKEFIENKNFTFFNKLLQISDFSDVINIELFFPIINFITENQNKKLNYNNIFELNKDQQLNSYNEFIETYDLSNNWKILINDTEKIKFFRNLLKLLNKKELEKQFFNKDIFESIFEYSNKKLRTKRETINTPSEINDLLVSLLSPKNEEKIYDPCVGSGGTFSAILRYLDNKNISKTNNYYFFGQDNNRKALDVCKLRMMSYGAKNVILMQGDSLIEPKFIQNNQIKKFDIVIAVPPWNVRGYDKERIQKGNFIDSIYIYGYPTKLSSDFLWVQHCLASIQEFSGRAALVLPTGILSREGSERVIREKIIEKDLIECIILLPDNLFSGISIPSCIIVLRKNREKKKEGKILYIKASNEAVTLSKNVNKLKINKINKCYHEFQEIKNFSRIISFKEIVKNKYNLKVKLYIQPPIESENINIEHEYEKLKKVFVNIHETKKLLQTSISNALNFSLTNLNKNWSKIGSNGKFKSGFSIKKINSMQIVQNKKNPIHFIRISNFDDVESNNFENIDKFSVDIPESEILKKGDILISKIIHKGLKICYFNSKKESIVDKSIVVLRTGDLYKSKYIYYLLKSDIIATKVQIIAKGAIIQRISLIDLKELQIPLLSVDEEKKFFETFSNLEKIIKMNTNEILLYDRIFQGLLNNLYLKK